LNLQSLNNNDHLYSYAISTNRNRGMYLESTFQEHSRISPVWTECSPGPLIWQHVLSPPCRNAVTWRLWSSEDDGCFSESSHDSYKVVGCYCITVDVDVGFWLVILIVMKFELIGNTKLKATFKPHTTETSKMRFVCHTLSSHARTNNSFPSHYRYNLNVSTCA
jgi:hypothetical protein